MVLKWVLFFLKTSKLNDKLIESCKSIPWGYHIYAQNTIIKQLYCIYSVILQTLSNCWRGKSNALLVTRNQMSVNPKNTITCDKNSSATRPISMAKMASKYIIFPGYCKNMSWQINTWTCRVLDTTKENLDKWGEIHPADQFFFLDR